MPLDFTDKAILKTLFEFKIKNGITFDQFIKEAQKIWEEVSKKETTSKK
jgi:hypothetical protein